MKLFAHSTWLKGLSQPAKLENQNEHASCIKQPHFQDTGCTLLVAPASHFQEYASTLLIGPGNPFPEFGVTLLVELGEAVNQLSSDPVHQWNKRPRTQFTLNN